MGTPLYNTDIIPLTSRPTLTVMDDGDYFVILDTSTGKISKILKTNIMAALKISYDNTTSGLTAETVQAALDELVVNLGSSGSAILALSGRLDTLEGTGEGSVFKAIDDALEPIEEDITDHEERIVQNESDIGTLEGVVDTNRLYSDSQYLALKAQADSLQVKCNTLQAEVYTDDPILQYGAVEVIGDGYEADDTPIDVSANVVDGKLSMEQKGLTITNLVKNGDFSQGTTGWTFNDAKFSKVIENGKVTLTALESLSHGTLIISAIPVQAYVEGNTYLVSFKYEISANLRVYRFTSITDLSEGVHEYLDIQTSYVSWLSIYYSTFTEGSTLSMWDFKVYNLTTLGLDHITDTDILAKLLPYVDGTKAVGKMGLQILDADDAVTQTILLPAVGNRLPNGTADSIKTVADGWEHVKRVSDDVIVSAPNFEFTSETATYFIFRDPSPQSNPTYFDMKRELGNYLNGAYATITISSTVFYRVGAIANFTDVYQYWFGQGRLYLSLPISYLSGYAHTSAGVQSMMNDLIAGDTPILINFELATPVTTKYSLPLPTSGKTIHRFAGEEKIALYGTGLTFSENVLSVLSAVKFVAGVMTDITSLATITGNTVTFSGVNATDVVYVKVEHDADRPLGILEHTPAVSNTSSRLLALETAVFGA